METLEHFKNSFFYGSRKDLLFKFLRNFTPEEAADFVRALLKETGAALDSGDFGGIAALVVDAQYRAYQPSPGTPPKWRYDDAPFAPLTTPLSDCRVALLTSSGHFVDGDDPKPLGVEGLTQEEAENRIQEFLRDAPSLSEIPVDTPRERLRVRHPGYDVRGALADPDVTLPIEPLRETDIGKLHDVAYSFVGAASQLRLNNELVPRWVERFRAAEIDAMVLVPV